jgi:hypothetical protein
LRLSRESGGQAGAEQSSRDVRSLGVDTVEEVIRTQGELGSFRTLQKQPAWRGRTTEEQLRRFIGSHSGLKIRSGALLVEALDLTKVPRPPDAVLAAASGNPAR